ncbi:MAG: LytR C-terminal domain-containing protein [Solirubrobacterales bacterium]
MLQVVKEVGSYAGLVALLGLAVLALLQFSQGRDLRRLRDWAGGAPEREAAAEQSTSDLAAKRAAELREIERAKEAERKAAEDRASRRERREAGLTEETTAERARSRMPQTRYLVLIVAVLVIVAGGVAYGAIHVLGGESGNGGRQARTGPTVAPDSIRVSVLNGTAVSGLAGRFGDALEKENFQLGAVSNTPSSVAVSEVMYKRGHRPEAAKVAAALKISKVRLMTNQILTAGAGAPVAVVVGEDRAASPPP